MFGRTGTATNLGPKSFLGLLSTLASSRKTFKRLLKASRLMGLTTNGSKKKSNGGGTGWGKLRRMSAATIRKGIAADPDAHATDENFWKSAKVVMPAR